MFFNFAHFDTWPCNKNLGMFASCSANLAPFLTLNATSSNTLKSPQYINPLYFTLPTLYCTVTRPGVDYKDAIMIAIMITA